jgi:hypothetical protein
MTFSVGETGGVLWRAAPSLGAVTYIYRQLTPLWWISHTIGP